MGATNLNVSLIVPTLNEIEGMQVIMPQIHPDWCREIIVVDGGSTDGTVAYARQRGYDVFVQSRPGIRQALSEALDRASGDIIIEFSPDGNSKADRIPDLIKTMQQGFDMVIVSRYLDGARSEDDDAVTAFGNRLFTGAINRLHGGCYTDTMCMFRAYRKELVDQLGLRNPAAYTYVERLFFTRLSWEPLMSIRAAKYGLRCTEIPGDEPRRIGGCRKLQVVRWGLAYMTQVFVETLAWRRR